MIIIINLFMANLLLSFELFIISIVITLIRITTTTKVLKDATTAR